MSRIDNQNDMRYSQLPLAGLRVGISGAVPERQYWGSVPDLERLILSFISQLSALILKYGGGVVHGSQPLFTPVLAEEARRHQTTSRSLTLIASQLWGKLPPVADRAAKLANASVILTPRIGEADVNDPDTRNKSLTAMRLTLAQKIDVLVAVGGKLHHETGLNAGVLEELTYARRRQVPCFIVAGFGGAAGSLEQEIILEFSAGNLLGAVDSGDRTPNRTTLDMATWTDTIDDYVGKLLLHLVKNRDTFLKSKEESAEIQFEERSFLDKTLSAFGFGDPYVVRVARVDVESVERSLQLFDRLRRAMSQENISEVKNILHS